MKQRHFDKIEFWIIVISISFLISMLYCSDAYAKEIKGPASRTLAQRVGTRTLYETAKACGCHVTVVHDSTIWEEDDDYLVYSFIYEVKDNKKGRRIQFRYKYSKKEKWASHTTIDINKPPKILLDTMNAK